MNTDPRAPASYDARTILLHWLTALLVVAQWLGAHAIDWFPRGPLRVDMRSVHIVLGVVLVGLLIWRLAWRSTGGRKLPPASPGVLGLAASLVHGLLYGLLLVIVGLGLLNVWVRGDSLFGLVQVPALGLGGKALKGQVDHLHALAANAILILAGLHAAAALWHHYVRKDGLLGRLIPALRGSPSS